MMKQLTEGCTDAAQEDTGHYGQRHEEAALHSPAGFKSWPCLISISRFVTSAGPLATKTKHCRNNGTDSADFLFQTIQIFIQEQRRRALQTFLPPHRQRNAGDSRTRGTATDCWPDRVLFIPVRTKLRPPTPPLLRNATGTFRDHFVFFLLLQIGVSVHPFDTLTSYSTASPF